jgi:NAD(P)-dependent dehydrogenase (short-subunit alcohol dehydrogenase family)
MTKHLEGRVALVTGASRGIGRAMALELANAGAHVIAVARTVGALEELDDEIKSVGGSATLVPLDLKDFEAIDRMGTPLAERWGKLDILFANAGMLGALTPLVNLKPKTFEDVMAVNVTANYRLIRSLEPLLKASDQGPRGVRDLGSGAQCARLLGCICGVQGGSGSSGANVG